MFVKLGCLRKSLGGNGYRICYWFASHPFYNVVYLTRSLEDVPKGSNDRPVQDVVISDSGEVCYSTFIGTCSVFILHIQLPVEPVVDEEGKEVPFHAEL
jgi:hypothetical protein